MPTLVNNILATTNNVGCYHGYKSVESTRSRTVNRISAPFPFLHLKPLAWRSLTCLSQKCCVLQLHLNGACSHFQGCFH